MSKILDKIKNELKVTAKRESYLSKQIFEISNLLNKNGKWTKNNLIADNTSSSINQERIDEAIALLKNARIIIDSLIKEAVGDDTYHVFQENHRRGEVFTPMLSSKYKAKYKDKDQAFINEICEQMVEFAFFPYETTNLVVLRKELFKMMSFDIDQYDNYKSIKSKFDNEYFQLYCKEIFVPSLSELLKEYKKGDINIEQLLYYAGDIRRDIACDVDDPSKLTMGRRVKIEDDNDNINIFHDKMMKDPISFNPNWEKWGNKILELVTAQNKNPQDDLKIGSIDDEYAKNFIEYINNAYIFGVKRNLHKKVDSAFYSTKDKSAVYVYRNEDIKKTLYCLHQPNTSAALEKIDSSIKEIVNDDDIAKEKLTESLAKILWHLYHGSWYYRGLAAIGENMSKALAKFSGWELEFPHKFSEKGEGMNVDQHVLVYQSLSGEYVNYFANYVELTKINGVAIGGQTINSD